MPILDRTSRKEDASLSFIPVPIPEDVATSVLQSMDGSMENIGGAVTSGEGKFLQGFFASEMKRPANIRMVMKASSGGDEESGRYYGIVFWKPDPSGGDESDTDSTDPLVGAVGIAIEILDMAFLSILEKTGKGSSEDAVQPVTVVGRAVHRFVVREVASTFPFVTAVVDEISDVKVLGPKGQEQKFNEERCLEVMRILTERRVGELARERSVLEEHILEVEGSETKEERALLLQQAKELANTVKALPQTMDKIDDPTESSYALGMLGLDILSLSSVSPDSSSLVYLSDLLKTVDSVARLELVTGKMEEEISLLRAKKFARELKEESSKKDESVKDLKVGAPSLPPWAKSIQAGTKVEYYWNEDYGWAGAKVMKRMEIAGELLFDLQFDDGESHRVPFLPDDKIRWRPPQL